jgi:hypothetical protein
VTLKHGQYLRLKNSRSSRGARYGKRCSAAGRFTLLCNNGGGVGLAFFQKRFGAGKWKNCTRKDEDVIFTLESGQENYNFMDFSYLS